MVAKVSDDLVLLSYRELCKRTDTNLSALALALSYQDHDSLVNLTIDPGEYSDAAVFSMDYLIVNFLSKWKGLQTGINTRTVALEAWEGFESQCRVTNERLSNSRLRVLNTRADAVMLMAKRKIARVLGPWKLRDVLHECRWSGGATYDLRRGSSIAEKMSRVKSVTRDALGFAKMLIESDPNWMEAITGFYPEGLACLLDNNFKIVDGNKRVTVPKNAKTDRTISSEPTMNAFLQQGVGRFIRRRLKRFGVDLDDQSINQVLAQKAYTCSLSTLDLKGASDTLSRELVYDLLPLDWYIYLDAIRSKRTRTDRGFVYLEKFSSMGNAFTFELESLIFWALVESTCELEGHEGAVSVYGDDIIIPRSSFDDVVDVLTFCGFSINLDKSFKDGDFFESCGKHYFRGVDVTPAYQKELCSDGLHEVIRMYNRLIRWSIRASGSITSRNTWSSCRLIIETSMKGRNEIPRIPLSDCSDDGFLSPRSRLPDYDMNHGYYCRVLVWSGQTKFVRQSPLLAYKLRRSTWSSAHPKGWAEVGSTVGNWVYRRRYIQSWQ